MSLDPTDPRLPAVERLALSRQRLKHALVELAGPPDEPHEPSVLMTALLGIPGVSVVVDAVRGWWSQHPLHLASLVAGNTARSAVGPMARRSPYKLMLAAAAVGGLIYWFKPWRGLLKPALLAGLVPHLVSRAMERVPVEAWVSAMSDFAAQRMGAGRNEAPAPASAPSAEGTGSAQGATSSPSAAVPPSSTLH